MKKHIVELRRLGACAEAIEWATKYQSAATAWRHCKRGDWMLWIAGRIAGPSGNDSRRPLVLAACGCARLALPIYEQRHPDDKRPRVAIETAEAWARGGEGAPTLEQVRAAYAAAVAAAYADAAYAAYAAAAAAAADAADAYAADAYAAVAVAAADAYADAKREEVLAQCADIVRKYYPKPPGGGK